MTQNTNARSDGKTSRSEATRERIFHAAVAVFKSYGYDTATMDDVATAAGVARRTAFNHFATKADIAVEWAVRRGQAAYALARFSASPSSATTLDPILAFFHELAVMTEKDWEETRQLTTGWMRGVGVPDHRPLLSGELREWLRGHLPEGPIDSTVAAEVLFDVFHGALIRWLGRQKAPRRGAFTKETDTIVAHVLTGLTRPEASATGSASGNSRGST